MKLIVRQASGNNSLQSKLFALTEMLLLKDDIEECFSAEYEGK